LSNFWHISLENLDAPAYKYTAIHISKNVCIL